MVGSNVNTESDNEAEHVLSVTARPNVTKFPKWARELIAEGKVTFGELVPADEDEDDDTVETA